MIPKNRLIRRKMMKKTTRYLAALLAALMLLSLAACGQGASAGGSAQNAAGDPTPEEEAPELPEPEPYEISDPMVMPEGGVRDGVTYAAYDGIVEHLFFHPVVAYPETPRPTALTITW